jgi:hypothetical protein
VNLTLFSSDKEQLVVEFVEVETHTAGKTVDKGILLVVRYLLVLVGDELQLNNFLRLKLVLHEVPSGHSAIR